MARTVPESATECVKVLDLEGRLVSINPRGCEMLEIDDPDRFIGVSWIELWGGMDAKTARACVARAARGEEARFEGFATTLRGTPRWWSTTIFPLTDADGKPRQLVAVSQDITLRVRRAHEASGLGDLKILVVEDGDDARDMLVLMLAVMGHRARGAASGAEALESVGAQPCDAIIVDIGLPDIDGLTLARRLRERIAANVAMLALSGYAQEEDRRRSLGAGFDAHLVKPIDPGELVRAVESVVATRRTAPVL